MNFPVILAYFSQSNGPEDPYLKFLQDENNAIAESWEGFKNKINVEFFPRQHVELDKIEEDIKNYKQRIIIFHYSGHAGNEHLLFNGETTNAIGLAGLLGEAQNLKLVFLNGCATQDQVKLLFQKNIKIVIATKGKVNDGIAKEFSTTFYEALVSPNYTIRTAFEHSVNAMKIKKFFPDDTPTAAITWRGLDTGKQGERDRWELYVKENATLELDKTAWWQLNFITPTKRETLQGNNDLKDKIIFGFIIILFLLGIAIIIKNIFFGSDLKIAFFGCVPILFSYFGFKNQERYKTTELNFDLADSEVIKNVKLFS